MALNEYVPTHWEDADSTASPINAASLNKIEGGIEAVTDAAMGLETNKMDKLSSGDASTVVLAKGNGGVKRSGYTVSTNPQDVSSGSGSIIPTAQAVKGYVSKATNATEFQDNGYVTPAQVRQCIDELFSTGSLYFQNGHLYYDDVNGSQFDLNI